MSVNFCSNQQIIEPQSPIDLRLTVAPVSWGRGRWPDHDWIDGEFWWVGWEHGSLEVRSVRQAEPFEPLLVTGPASESAANHFAERILGIDRETPTFKDETLASIAFALNGLRPYSAGSLFQGLVSSIVGQSISVASAAVTQARLWSLFHPGVEFAGRRFWPAPTAEDLAACTPELVCSTGVTRKRADSLVALGREVVLGNFPDESAAFADPEAVAITLDEFPQVGPWTAQSALLWGLGLPDAHPTGDVALLRAARSVYRTADMSLRELDELADRWRPNRGWAARFLWTDLLGSAS